MSDPPEDETHDEPSVNFEDSEIRSQAKCVRDRNVRIFSIGIVHNAELLNHCSVSVTQKRELSSKTGPIGRCDPRRVYADHHQAGIVELYFRIETDELTELSMVSGTKVAPIKNHDQRPAFGKPESALKLAYCAEVREPNTLARLIWQSKVRQALAGLESRSHTGL